MGYFKYFRKTDYLLSERVLKTVTNITQYSSILPRIIDDIYFYTYYTMDNAERLDIISHKLYDTDAYYWTIPLVNEHILSTWRDLNKSTNHHQIFLRKKYPGMAFTMKQNESIIGKFIAHEKLFDIDQPDNYCYLSAKYPSRGYIVGHSFGPDADFEDNKEYTLQGEQSGDLLVTNNFIPFHLAPNHYLDEDGNYVLWGSGENITPITINELEIQDNIKKLQIKVIRPEIINDVVKGFEQEMKKQ